MLCEAPGWEDLLGWLMASSVPDVLAAGGGGVVVRESVERKGGEKERVSPLSPIPGLFGAFSLL